MTRALLVGDSLAAAAETELLRHARLLGVDLRIRARAGRSIGQAVRVLESDSTPDVVIALGTNDAGAARSVIDEIVQGIVDAVAGRCVFVSCHGVHHDHGVVNAAITNAAALQPSVSVVDWASVAATAAASLLELDGVHLSERGSTVWAEAILTHVAGLSSDPAH